MTDHTGLLGVLGAEAAFTDGDDWLDAVLNQLESNRALLVKRLAERLPEVAWTPPQASYLAWLDCRQLGLGDDPAEQLNSRAQVRSARSALRATWCRACSIELRHQPAARRRDD